MNRLKTECHKIEKFEVGRKESSRKAADKRDARGSCKQQRKQALLWRLLQVQCARVPVVEGRTAKVRT